MTFDADNWLLSLHEELERYVKSYFTPELYQIQMSYPDTSVMRRGVPLAKTLIHFEQDNTDHPVLGLGDNILASVLDQDAGTVVDQEGQWHDVNFDVGIWTSAERGGDRARLRAHQLLTKILHGARAHEDFYTFTDGLTIKSFTGGRYFTDVINDLPVWRAADMTLVVRAGSREVRPAVPLLHQELDGTNPGIVFQDELTMED